MPHIVRKPETARPRKLETPQDIERRTVVRRPQRQRGLERFELLLNATEHLLAYCPNEDISLATIAEQARVPLPSVYHFFPNRNAALVALAGRYHRELAAIAQERLDPPPSAWQDIVRQRQRVDAAFLNRHPAALRLFMGAGVSVEVRNLDLRGNAANAATRAADFHRHFQLDHTPDLENRIAITIGLQDGIWAISYSEFGSITDAYLAESSRAAIAYLRCYLPEYLPPRLSPEQPTSKRR